MRIRHIIQAAALGGLLVQGAVPALAQNRTTTVEGIVFADHDGDGRRSTDEAGLDGMRVAVLDGPTGKSLVTDAGAQVQVRTSSTGFYSYQAPGNLDLRFRLLGGDGWLESTPAERRVTLTSGATQSGVDFGYQPTRMSAVEGVVFDDRNRNGRRDRGEPGMRDIHIVLLDPSTGQPLRRPDGRLVDAVTDRGGHYRHEALGSVDLRLRPRHPDGWLDTNPAEHRIQLANGTVRTGVDFAF